MFHQCIITINFRASRIFTINVHCTFIIDFGVIAINQTTGTAIGECRITCDIQCRTIAIDNNGRPTINFRLTIISNGDIITGKNTYHRTFTNRGSFAVVVQGDVVTVNVYHNAAIQGDVAAMVGNSGIVNMEMFASCTVCGGE